MGCFDDLSCVGADDGEFRGLGFCGVEDKPGLMTTTEQAPCAPMAAFVIGGTGMLFSFQFSVGLRGLKSVH